MELPIQCQFSSFAMPIYAAKFDSYVKGQIEDLAYEVFDSIPSISFKIVVRIERNSSVEVNGNLNLEFGGNYESKQQNDEGNDSRGRWRIRVRFSL